MTKMNRSFVVNLKCVRFSCMSLGIVIIAAFNTVQAADFIQNSTCGLTNPAFTEKFDAAYPGGRGGDLDETKWSISRWANYFFGAFTYLKADIPACKQGAPSTAFPDDEILVCDNSIPGYSGRLMVAMAGQNYGLTAFRVNQPFDFAGRTGTIAFDVDAYVAPVCDANGHFVSMVLSEDPIPAPNIPHWEHSGTPKNALVFDFAGVRPNQGFCHVFHDYVDLVINSTVGCLYQAGSLNHIEVKVSQNAFEIWSSDYSTDGKTFPNFKKIASTNAINLPFTRGYVSFGVNNHASDKYGCVITGIHYWDNLGFDGPVISSDRVYAVPNPKTMFNASSMNIGWSIDNQGMSTCCGAGTGRIQPITLHSIDLTNAVEARIALSGLFNSIADYTKAGFVYRLNSGTWRYRYLTAGEYSVMKDITPSIPHVLPVPLADLKQGDNTLELTAVGASNMGVTNIELNIKASGQATNLTRNKNIAGKDAATTNRICIASERLVFPRSSALGSGLIELYDVKGKLIGQAMQRPDGAVKIEGSKLGRKAVILNLK